MNNTETHLLNIAMIMAQTGATREQIIETIEIAKGPMPQRLLNEEEYNIFAGAVARAVVIMPAFRDAVALIRPFRDYQAATIYTDQYSRVGIGTYFFLKGNDPIKRASLLLHEAMHVLNNHFTRSVDFTIGPEDNNCAQDLEINSLLIHQKGVVLDDCLVPADEPYEFPEFQSYEQYALLMKNKGLLRNPGENSPEEQQAGSPGQTDSENESGPAQPGESADSDGSPTDKAEDGEGESSDDANDSKSSSSSSDKAADGDESSEGSSSDKSDSELSDSSGDSGSPSSGKSEGKPGEDSDPESIADRSIEAVDKDTSSKDPGDSACQPSTSRHEKIADDLDVERASSTEQAVARNNTIARVREEALKSKERGDRAALMLLQKLELAMEPSQVDWRVIFRNIVSNSRDAISMGRTEHTYKRVNRRLSSGEFVFPGMIRYEPSAIMAIDTSGSMSKEDYAFLLSELESIVKSALKTKDRFKAFCVDAAATEPKSVKSIKDLDLRGGGGTRMEIAIKSIELLPKRNVPDIFILATDGGTDWSAFKRELLRSKRKYKTVVLITREHSYEIARSTLVGIADVIDISPKTNGRTGY